MTFLTRRAREKGIHEAFEISIALKGIGALVETILGAALLFTDRLIEVVFALVENELIDDPNDFFATHVRSFLLSPHAADATFGGLYLLSHGVVKLFLVAGLWRGKLWAYPASLAVFALFILYQLVRFARTHSPWLLALTALDLVIMWLIFHEYRRLMRGRDPETALARAYAAVKRWLKEAVLQ